MPFTIPSDLFPIPDSSSAIVLCNESYTSKTCPECGHVHKQLGGNKKFQCPKCGYTAHRDGNGARNIMLRALQD